MNNKGITLVALVITVIILLILAGVAINAVRGGEGLFSKTKQAGEMYNNSAIEEAELIEKLVNAIEQNKNNGNNSGGENGGGENTPNSKFDGKVQTPQLLTGMTAIKLATSTEKETLTEITNPLSDTTWYNYENRQWANAVTKNSEGQITGYWVWIPRYEYKITYANESNKSAGGTIDVKFIPTTQTTADSGYKLHPAFLNGTENKFANGEWDKELPGFWVAKFEAGYAGNSTSYPNTLHNGVTAEESQVTQYNATADYYGKTGTNPVKYPVFLGTTFAYNNMLIGNMYNLSKSLTQANNPYGLSSTTESHLMKNSEWGAVAYLSYSQYGTNGVEPYVNNVSLKGKVTTIYGVTGYAGISSTDTVNEFNTAPTKLGASISNGTKTSYAWYTTNGEKASSTMNITGVYDLNGGSYESIAGYIPNNNVSALRGYGTGLSYTAGEYVEGVYVAGVPITESTKYSTVYPYDTSNDNSTPNAKKLRDLLEVRYGDAIAEISSLESQARGWNADFAAFPQTTQPFFVRGDSFVGSDKTGLFSFYYTGGSSMGLYGFRVVLAE